MTNAKSRPITFGMIVGNRGFFPDHLAKSGREDMIAAIQKAGFGVIAVGANDTKYGAIETRTEAAVCADLFKKHRDEIDGIIVTLPNFGDERAIADTLRFAGLDVPVLVQATPDTPGRIIGHPDDHLGNSWWGSEEKSILLPDRRCCIWYNVGYGSK